jgi:regulator of replication initiation timing
VGGGVRRVATKQDVKALTGLLLDDLRTRPVVVVSIPQGEAEPWIDAAAVADEAGDLVDVWVLPTSGLSWEFAGALPPEAQVYGGAGRVYPVDPNWDEPRQWPPLRMVYRPEQAKQVQDNLISDALTAALRAGLLPGALRSRAHPSLRAGTVIGTTANRAIVELDGGALATVVPELTVPQVPIEALVVKGQRVRGYFDPGARRLDIRDQIRPGEEALADYTPGGQIWVRVAKAGSDWLTVEPYPRLTVRVPAADVTDLADMSDLFSPGEVVRARVAQCDPLRLRFDDLNPDEPTAEAPSLLPGGPPWIRPAVRQVRAAAAESSLPSGTMPSAGPPASGRPTLGAASGRPGAAADSAPPGGAGRSGTASPDARPKPHPRPGDRVAPRPPPPAPGPPEPGPPEPGPPEPGPPEPGPPPSGPPPSGPPEPGPRLSGPPPSGPRPEESPPEGPPVVKAVPKPAPPLRTGPGGPGLTPLEVANLKAHAEKAKQDASKERERADGLASERAGLRFERDELRQEADLLAQENNSLQHEVARLKTALREATSANQRLRREANPSAGQPAEPLDLVAGAFGDPVEQLRFEVQLAWALRVGPGEKTTYPLGEFTVGPDFLATLEALQGVTRPKVIEVIVDVVTGRAKEMPGRDLHPLRSGPGGSPQRTRPDGAKGWRVALQLGSPSARRLHYWVKDGIVELARVGTHDEDLL